MNKEEFRNKIKNAIGFDELENLSFKSKRKLEKRLIYLYFCNDCDLSQLSIPKIQQEYLKVLNNNDFYELNYLDNSDVL